MNNGDYDDKLLPHQVHYQKHLNPFGDAAIGTHHPPTFSGKSHRFYLILIKIIFEW